MTRAVFPYPVTIAAPRTMQVSDTVSLRLSTPETAPELFAAFDASRHNLGDYTYEAATYTLEDAIQFAEETRDFAKDGVFTQYEILHNGTVNGEVTMVRLDKVTANLGYWRSQDNNREGIATQSVAKVAQFGFEGWSLESILLDISDNNVKSQAVAKRLGATLTGLSFCQSDGMGNEDLIQQWELRP